MVQQDKIKTTRTNRVWVAATNYRGHFLGPDLIQEHALRADLTEDTLSGETLELLTLMIQQDTVKLPETNRVWVKQPLTEDAPSDQIQPRTFPRTRFILTNLPSDVQNLLRLQVKWGHHQIDWIVKNTKRRYSPNNQGGSPASIGTTYRYDPTG